MVATVRSPALARVTTFFFAVSTHSSFIVLVLFWLLVFPNSSSPPSAFNVVQHGVNFIVVVLDLVLSGQPLAMAHGLYTLSFGVVYFIWSGIFHGAGLTSTCQCTADIPGCLPGANTGESQFPDRCKFLYQALNWNDAGSAAITVVMTIFIFVPVTVALCWALVCSLGFVQGLRRAGAEALARPRGFGPGCCGALREELRASRLSLDMGADWAVAYGVSPLFPSMPTAMLAGRVALAGTWLGLVLWAMVTRFRQGEYFVYLTSWSNDIQLVYHLLAVATTVAAQRALATAGQGAGLKRPTDTDSLAPNAVVTNV